MRASIKLVIAFSLLLPVVALAKGDGVGFSMEGTVTNDVKMAVGTGKDYGDFTLSDAAVVRATDADLR